MGLIRRLFKDKRGVAGIEFALIGSLMVSVLVGMVELDRLVGAATRATTTAQSVADLVAQDNVQTDRTLTSIGAAAGMIMTPFAAGPDKMNLSVYSVGFDRQGNPVVLWQKDLLGAVPVDLGRVTGLGEGKESVIVAALTYTYTSPFGFAFGSRTIDEVAFARPRIATARSTER